MGGIICDLTKSFYCVNHEPLLSDLKYYEVRGVILEWLKPYLNNRKQRVDLEFIKTHCYCSGQETVKRGGLQDCVLGPLLFNMYINDFPKIIIKLSHTLLFADDTIILVTSTNCIELNQKLNSILHHISKWFQTN